MVLNWKAYHFLISFFFLATISAAGQDQKVADSLKRIYQQKNLEDSSKLELLRNIAFNESKDLNLAVQYAEELISLSTRLGNNVYLHRGYLQKGNKKRIQGNLEEALDAYFKSVEAARNANFIKGEGSAYGAIADIYSVSNNHPNAMLYYHKAISTLRKSNDSVFLASAISNAGDEFLNNKIYDSALLHFKESGLIFEKINYLTGKAYSLGNIGMVYANIGQSTLAEKNINEAIRILEELEDYYPICVYLLSMCDIYFEKGDDRTALNYALKSLRLAQQYGLKEQISDANHKLAKLYEKAGDMVESYRYYKNYIAYRDSVNNIKSVQNMADLRTNFEVSRKQIEVDLLNQQKENQRIVVIASVVAALLIFLIALVLYRRYLFIKSTNRIIEEERNRSDSLLLNILPEETAQELKLNGRVQTKKFESVTVLFTDFKEFTKLAEQVDPEQLIRSIDFYFKEFDKITTKYGLEKIKTIGDSYMCAGGLPLVSSNHARQVAKAAKEMIDLVNEKLLTEDDLIHFEVRIGIHTGPVVAGIVGMKKWQYDIWGDTVNIASRMESTSHVGKINLSETTYQAIKDEFPCTYRGEMEVKNRGELKMYYLI